MVLLTTLPEILSVQRRGYLIELLISSLILSLKEHIIHRWPPGKTGYPKGSRVHFLTSLRLTHGRVPDTLSLQPVARQAFSRLPDHLLWSGLNIKYAAMPSHQDPFQRKVHGADCCPGISPKSLTQRIGFL